METNSPYDEKKAARLLMDIFAKLGGTDTATTSVVMFSLLAATIYRMGKELDKIISAAEEKSIQNVMEELLDQVKGGDKTNGVGKGVKSSTFGTIQDNS